LRLHHGYAWAPDPVLAAVAGFLRPGARRAERAAARAVLLSFPAESFAPSTRPLVRRPEAARPGDDHLLARLRELHGQLNREYFGGRLAAIPIRLSARMRRRLGELRVDRATGTAEEIGIARRHLRRDGWEAVRETLLHEMVHQWQAESALPVDHGPEFRRKARAVGIEPRAMKSEQGAGSREQ
ncbi:MAG: SprT-like domain-containing protein, partial [Gemmatimonadales bacterium]